MPYLYASLLFACAVLGRPAWSQPSAIEQQMQSIEKQRAAMAVTLAAVARMREGAVPGPRSVAHSPPGEDAAEPVLPPLAALTAPPALCDPLPPSMVDPIIESAARRQNLQVNVLRAVIGQESAFRPCAVSAKGARGLMQLMPATAEQFGVKDPFDPVENIQAGAKLLRQLLTSYGGDLARALGAYNAGPANVPRLGALPDFPETRNYVRNIMGQLSVSVD